jgi:hypothetical protein
MGGRVKAYLLHGPLDGQFLAVPGTFPPRKLLFPVALETAYFPEEDVDLMAAPPVAEYFLDSVLPMPYPFRGKLATYRFRSITQAKEKT